jgi:hypothetical protein
MRFRNSIIGLATVLWAALSACEAPVYDEEIGMEAIPAEEGAHAGTFAAKSVSTTVVHIPVLGDREGGGINYRLVTREWDGEAGVYRQQSQLCGGYNFEVAGVTVTLPESSYRAVPASEEEVVTIEHNGGTYAMDDHVQLWAIDLPDPLNDPLPEDAEEAEEAPHKDRIYDMDEDDNVGVTSHISGAVEGEVYGIQRKWIVMEGIILGPDRALGFAENSYESIDLGNNNPLLDTRGGSSEPHPDRKESWFEEVRIDDGSDCDDVMSAEDDGVLSRLRPY